MYRVGRERTVHCTDMCIVYRQAFTYVQYNLRWEKEGQLHIYTLTYFVQLYISKTLKILNNRISKPKKLKL